MNVEVRDYFAQESQKMKAANPSAQGIKSALLPNFDTNKDHARLIAEVTADAVNNKGLTIQLKKKGQAALAPNSVGKPGVVLPGVTHMGDTASEWTAAPKK
jgi:hypothetical protein